MCSPHGSSTSCALRSNLPLPSFRGRHSGAAKVVWPSVAHAIPECLQQGCYGHSNTHGDTIGDIIWHLSTTDIQQTFMASRESLHANIKNLPGKRWLGILGIDHFISAHLKKTDVRGTSGEGIALQASNMAAEKKNTSLRFFWLPWNQGIFPAGHWHCLLWQDTAGQFELKKKS